jgi:hypothetical protein
MRSFVTVSAQTGAIIFTLVVGQLAVTTTALAQKSTRPLRSGQVRNNPTPQQQRQLPFIKISGKVTNLQQGAIAVDTDKGSYIVRLDPQQTRVTVVGEGTVDALEPGVLVQFQCVLNPRLTLASEPIEKLKILTPSARTAPGVISDTPKDHSKPFTVRGKISRVVGPQLTIAAYASSRKQVRAELAEEVVVEMELSDFSLVANGDRIEVQGAEVNSGLVHATDIKITLSKPSGKIGSASEDSEPEEQTAKRGKPRRRGQAKKER